MLFALVLTINHSIHLQAVPPPLPSPPLTPPEPSDSTPLPAFPTSAFAPRKPFFAFSLSLGSSQPRLFRSWFEDPSLSCAEPIATDGCRSVSSSLQTLNCAPSASSPSALLSATMLCTLVTPSPPPPSSTVRGQYFQGRGYTPTPPRLFEFSWSEVKVDVGRFVVGAEEGLGWGEVQRKMMFLFR